MLFWWESMPFWLIEKSSVGLKVSMLAFILRERSPFEPGRSVKFSACRLFMLFEFAAFYCSRWLYTEPLLTRLDWLIDRFRGLNAFLSAFANSEEVNVVFMLFEKSVPVLLGVIGDLDSFFLLRLCLVCLRTVCLEVMMLLGGSCESCGKSRMFMSMLFGLERFLN